ncbi:unnamed protein product [Brugia pahangi]|uniref:Frizzled domain-containing protein n=1 Tax=Brugia pahangi TaxID=6280 RepID=A0A0N4THU2_BRUPA|nr:unnamed protein product [Brugia pahangi]
MDLTGKLYICAWLIAMLIVTVIICCVIRRYLSHCCGTSTNYSYGAYCSCNLLQLLLNLKSVIRPKRKHFWYRTDSNFTQSLRHIGSNSTQSLRHIGSNFTQSLRHIDSNFTQSLRHLVTDKSHHYDQRDQRDQRNQ